MSVTLLDATHTTADAKEIANRRSLLKGMRIRDEFICPITYELMREPVVASDGHTYEKNAIEKWLKTNHTSPRSGEPLDSTTIIPNINLKKLIQDIINEGGAGFYTNDMSDRDRVVEVCAEKLLILECLGPTECEWNQQSFQVGRSGCIGGRRHNMEDHSKEVVVFKDITVSRKHFEITQMSTDKEMHFYLRDLGSAGGTFIRILFGARKELHIGMIILLGKHQFTVSSIDDSGASEEHHASKNRNSLTRKTIMPGDAHGALRRSGLDSEVLKSLVKNAEMIIEDISKGAAVTGEEKMHQNELSARLKSLTAELSNHLGIEDGYPQLSSKADAKDAGRDPTPVRDLPSFKPGPGDLITSYNDEEMKDERLTFVTRDKKDSDDEDLHSDRLTTFVKRKTDFSTRRLTLTCCAPDGSPLQGKSFVVGPEGATMGRKTSNNISLVTPVETNGEKRMANVDTAISSEHARVEFDADTGRFYISDGTKTKPSTNGTWFRLSGPHQESPPHLISAGTEVLIGSIRFQVKESMTISERRVEEK